MFSDPSTKNQFGSKTLVGNYNEDRWGAELSRVKVAEALPTGSSEYGARYTPKDLSGVERARAALPPPDTIDAYLTLAHGVDYIERAQKPEHFMTMSQAATRGARVADTLRDRSDQPHELNRTTLIRAKAKMIAAGVDSWDLSSSHAPLRAAEAAATVFATGVVPAAVASVDAHARPSALSTTVGAQTLGASAVLTHSVEPRPDVPYFGRSTEFSRQHYRGLARGAT